MTNEQAHRLAREKGVSRPLYAVVRGVARAPASTVLPDARVGRRAHARARGAAIVAPNHKSFWDSFFIAVCTRRHLRFMAKTELIEARYGRLLVRLGAFPVRRGQSDEDALETARTILRQGGLLALFPEGTRIRDPDELGHPKRGAGRLALEEGAPIVPAAITGTETLFLGAVPEAAPRAGGVRPADRGRRAGGDPGGGRRGGGGEWSGPRSRASSAACARGRR